MKRHANTLNEPEDGYDMGIIPPPPPPPADPPGYISIGGGVEPRRPKAPPPQPTISYGYQGRKPRPEASYGTIGSDELQIAVGEFCLAVLRGIGELQATTVRGLFTTQDWRATSAIWMGVSLGCFVVQVIT